LYKTSVTKKALAGIKFYEHLVFSALQHWLTTRCNCNNLPISQLESMLAYQ